MKKIKKKKFRNQDILITISELRQLIFIDASYEGI